jgi:type I restriction-modification system DNA methylase subunit
MHKQKNYSCGICGTIPDQLSHHKSHLETEKHKIKTELFKIQVQNTPDSELEKKYNTIDRKIILAGIETISSNYKINKIDKMDNPEINISKKLIDTSLEDNNINQTAIMTEEARESTIESADISNRDALRDKIHEIHNFLRNNGAGYGMSALKVFNIFYGLKKFELCNEAFINGPKWKLGMEDLYAKYKLSVDCKFSTLLEKANYNGINADDILQEYIINNLLDGINDSDPILRKYLMYEIPRNMHPKVYKHIIRDIDSITEIEKKCNVLLSGKIYEYFIGRDDTAISELGAYFTDRHIVNYILDKLDPKPNDAGEIDEMIDMFGGSGGFTTGYIDYLMNKYPEINWENEIKKIYHYDMNEDVIKSAWLEMFCLTGNLPERTNVNYKNSFMDEFENKKFKRIITNPPYGGDKVSETEIQIKHTKIREYIKTLLPSITDPEEKKKLNIQLTEIVKLDKEYTQKLENAKVGLNEPKQLVNRTSQRINKFAKDNNITKANDKESVSLIMLMDMVDVGGTVCGVLKEGVFFNKTYKEIRKCLIEKFNVREVISVPQDQFENTSTKTSIIIFDNHETIKTSHIIFRDLIVERFTEDRFIVKNGYVYLVENKGDISRVTDIEISSATRAELLANPNCSLNGKDYNKKTIEPGEGFKLVKLGDIANIENGYAFKTSEYVDSGIPLLTIKHIPDFNLEGCNYIKENEKYKKFIINKNDILMTMTGDTETVGRVGIYNMDNKIYCNQRVCKITINNIIKRNYSYFIIQTLSKFIIGNGSIQKNISGELIKKIDIPIPTTDQSIKQWVDKISKPFDEKNSKEQKLKTLELDIQNRIKEITENENCDEVEVGSICDVKSGDYITKDKMISGYILYMVVAIYLII